MNLHQLPRAPWRVVESAATWHLRSQHHARRNALVASTALMQRRRELTEVEDFLTAYDARASARARPDAGAASGPARSHTA